MNLVNKKFYRLLNGIAIINGVQIMYDMYTYASNKNIYDIKIYKTNLYGFKTRFYVNCKFSIEKTRYHDEIIKHFNLMEVGK